MKRFLILGGLLSAGLFTMADVAQAHGGQYRGPGDVVPPGGGSRPNGPSTPSRPGAPSTPSTPSTPSSPATPAGPGTAPGGSRGPTTGGIDISSALESWSFWWEFNRERFLNLKARISAVPPSTDSDEFHVGFRKKAAKDVIGISRDMVRSEILPIIREVLEKHDERAVDEVSSALIALGKFGVEPEQTVKDITRFLSDKNQETKETAAVALGILADPAAIENLTALLKDDAIGRRLTDEREVDLRTRAFAAYGLGLIGYQLKGAEYDEQRREITKTLTDVMLNDSSPIQDIRIAAITALGLIPHEKQQRQEVMEALLTVLNDRKTNNIDLIRAHVPTAIARLEGIEHINEFVKILGDKKENQFVRQSVVLALGLLGRAVPPDQRDAVLPDVVKTLITVQEDGRSLQEKYFTNIALGQVGTDKAIDHLIRVVQKGKNVEQPWGALGLGVYGFDLPSGMSPDARVKEVVHQAFVKEKDPSNVGAFAITLGLLKAKTSQDQVARAFEEARIDETKGYLAISLGLMGANDKAEDIRNAVNKAKRRAEQLQLLSIALGVLSDKEIVPILVDIMREARTTAVYAAVAQALGFIGDQRSVDPLVKLVANKDLSGEARAFAIVALGIVGDKEELPWNTKISQDMNYRASVNTLTGGSIGVLDIL